MFLTTKKSHGALLWAPWFTLSLIFFMIALYIMGQTYFDLLIFDKQAICQGQIWRIITGHFVHCSLNHLFWNLFAFAILGTIIEFHKPQQLLPSLLISSISISFWLLIANICYPTYCGLSGALNGLLVIAVVAQWKVTGKKTCAFILLTTLGKITYELIFKQTLFTNLSLQLLPSAHATGFIAGIFYLFFLKKICTKTALIHQSSA